MVAALTTEPKPVCRGAEYCEIMGLPHGSQWLQFCEQQLQLSRAWVNGYTATGFVFACNHWHVPVHTVPSFVGRQVPHGWAAGGCIEALVVMVIPGFGWVAHLAVIPCAPGCRGVWSSASLCW